MAEVLARFGKTVGTSRKCYRLFVEDGTAMGHRKDLTGSGKLRRQSAQDGSEEELRDLRVLGSGDFVERLLMQTEAIQTFPKVPLEEIIENLEAGLISFREVQVGLGKKV